MTDLAREQEPVLTVEGLCVSFPVRDSRGKPSELRAVDDVSLELYRGETLGLVGESGSGKSTLARSIVGLARAQRGKIVYEGTDLARLNARDRRRFSREIQMIFQDPYRSLNPRRTVGELMGEIWEVHPYLLPARSRQARIEDLLVSVGLDPAHANRYPHELSGGQCQRIAIARCLAMEPSIIICDEAVSALDVSVQAQILNLLAKLQRERGLTYLFISHDLSVVHHISNRVAVMYLGRVVESGNAAQLLSDPLHPYTKALLSAVPHPKPWEVPDRERIILTGEIPSRLAPPEGCRFHTRCWLATQQCVAEEPGLQIGPPGHSVACHFWEKARQESPASTYSSGLMLGGTESR